MNYDACFLFRGDIRYDSRVSNFVRTFTQRGKKCTVVQGAKSNESFTWNGVQVASTEITRRGPLGFFEYWRKSGKLAAEINAHTWWAAELYSLPLAARRARLSGGHCVYDAREIFAHLGGLEGRPLVQSFWRWSEGRYIRRANAVITTGPMDAEFLAARYGINRPHVVRNLPYFREIPRGHFLHDRLAIPHATPICLYTGGLQIGRGIPAMLNMAQELPEAAFVFVGAGPLGQAIQSSRETQANIYHLPAIPNDMVLDCAASATIGFALIEPISLSYQYALPNKLFEYIMARTPVIVSDMPQMKAVVDRYNVGFTVPADSLGDAVGLTRRLLSNQELHAQMADSCKRAASELNWEREIEPFITFARQNGIL